MRAGLTASGASKTREPTWKTQPYLCKHKKETNAAIKRHSESTFHQKAYAHMLSHSFNAIPKAVVQLNEVKLDAISKVLSNMFWLCKEKIALAKASSLKELMILNGAFNNCVASKSAEGITSSAESSEGSLSLSQLQSTVTAANLAPGLIKAAQKHTYVSRYSSSEFLYVIASVIRHVYVLEPLRKATVTFTCIFFSLRVD